MTKLKSLVMAVVVALAAVSAFADTPVFDVEGVENAVVLDARADKKPYGDYIQIINFTDDTDAAFNIYGYDKKAGWVFITKTGPQVFGESVLLETSHDHKLVKFTAFAIAAENGKAYSYTFSKFIINMYVVKHAVAGIRITPQRAALSADAYSFESASVKGSFKDRVKVEGDEAVVNGKSFVIYGSDDNENWSVIAGGTVKKDGSYLEAVSEDKVSKYKFYAIENRENEKFNYTVTKAHNDLYFTVTK